MTKKSTFKTEDAINGWIVGQAIAGVLSIPLMLLAIWAVTHG